MSSFTALSEPFRKSRQGVSLVPLLPAQNGARFRASQPFLGPGEMKELDRRIATLRLRLAEVSSRQEQLRILRRQFRTQLERLTDFAVLERGDLDSAISMADDVDQRLAQTERSLRYLDSVRTRGQEELDALLLTRSIEAAKAELTELESRLDQVTGELRSASARVPASGQDLGTAGTPATESLLGEQAKLEAEVTRLRRVISNASEQAARAVSERARQRAEP